MTTSVDERRAGAPPEDEGAARAAGRRGVARRPARARPPKRPATLSEAVLSSVMLLLALLLIAVVLEVSVVGAVRHARSQAQAYDAYRVELASGTAPVGQVDYLGALLQVGTPVAIMKAPSIGLDEVVLEGTSSTVTAQGPGHRRDTVLPGQAGVSLVIGRRAGYGGPFAHLADLRPGDPITVTTGQGEQRYEVLDVRYPGDEAPALAQGEGRLTLATAAGPPYLPTDVVRVDARLVSKPQDAPAMVVSAAALAPSEQLMAGDRGVALRLYLWTQLLLVCGVALVLLRRVFGRWQTWVVALPVLVLCSLGVAQQLAMLLPNML